MGLEFPIYVFEKVFSQFNTWSFQLIRQTRSHPQRQVRYKSRFKQTVLNCNKDFHLVSQSQSAKFPNQYRVLIEVRWLERTSDNILILQYSSWELLEWLAIEVQFLVMIIIMLGRLLFHCFSLICILATRLDCAVHISLYNHSTRKFRSSHLIKADSPSFI